MFSKVMSSFTATLQGLDFGAILNAAPLPVTVRVLRQFMEDSDAKAPAESTAVEKVPEPPPVDDKTRRQDIDDALLPIEVSKALKSEREIAMSYSIVESCFRGILEYQLTEAIFRDQEYDRLRAARRSRREYVDESEAVEHSIVESEVGFFRI